MVSTELQNRCVEPLWLLFIYVTNPLCVFSKCYFMDSWLAGSFFLLVLLLLLLLLGVSGWGYGVHMVLYSVHMGECMCVYMHRGSRQMSGVFPFITFYCVIYLLIILFLNIINYFQSMDSLSAYISVYHLHTWCTKRPERRYHPRTGVIGNCEPLCS